MTFERALVAGVVGRDRACMKRTGPKRGGEKEEGGGEGEGAEKLEGRGGKREGERRGRKGGRAALKKPNSEICHGTFE